MVPNTQYAAPISVYVCGQNKVDLTQTKTVCGAHFDLLETEGSLRPNAVYADTFSVFAAEDDICLKLKIRGVARRFPVCLPLVLRQKRCSA